MSSKSPLLLFLPVAAGAQWQPLTTGTTVSLRGLSVVSESVVWASGTRGTVIRTIDGGTTWAVESIPGASRMDVRSIHARSANVAHAAATAGRIWRTTDGGKTWSLRYQASDTTVFLDAITFFDDKRGLALGDPIGGRFLLLVTQDGGDTWQEAPIASRPPAVAGEAAFAASGTALVSRAPALAWIGSGGGAAHAFVSRDAGKTWTAYSTPLVSGAPSQGVFSVAFGDAMHGVAVGGDYQRADSTRGNAAFSSDGGRSWTAATVAPHGYRSGATAIVRATNVTAIAVGTSGSDISSDGGRTWTPIDSTGFNAVQFAPGGTAYAVGAGGRVAKLTTPHTP